MTLAAASPETKFTFSRFLREPKIVAAAAAKRPVYLERRDGPELVLMQRSFDEANKSGLAIASIVMEICMNHSGSAIDSAVLEAFPWAHFLTKEGQRDFSSELIATTRASASLGSFERLSALLAQWKSTAEAYEAGWDKTEYEWLDQPLPVARP